MRFKGIIPIICVLVLCLSTLSVIGEGQLDMIDHTVRASPSIINTGPGSTVSNYVGTFIEDNWDVSWNGWVWNTGTIYESDKLTPLSEVGWKIEGISHLQNGGWVSECSDNLPLNGYSCYFYKNPDTIYESHTSHSLYAWFKITIPSTTTKTTVYVKHTVEESLTRMPNGDKPSDSIWEFSTYWFQINIISPKPTFYNIDMSVSELPATIDPEETVLRTITVYNNGSKILPVGIYYEPKLKDNNGDTVKLDGWKTSIFDTTRTSVYYLSIPANATRTCALEITAPEKDKAPPDCTFYVYLNAKVLNDTTYGDSVTLSTDTSSEFTGDGNGLWSLPSNWLYSPYLWIVIIIIICVVAWLLYRNRTGGRRSRSKGR